MYRIGHCSPLIQGVWRLALSLLACLAAAASEPGYDGADAALLRAGFFPIPLEASTRNMFVVRGDLDGRSTLFLVDTGWGSSSLDHSLCRSRPSLAAEHEVLAGALQRNSADTNVFLAKELRFSECRFFNFPFNGADFLGTTDPVTREIRGILGWDFLVENHAVLRCSPPRLFVRSAAPGEPEKRRLRAALEKLGFASAPLQPRMVLVATNAAGRRLAASARSGVPLVDLRLDGHNLCCILDSGASATLLDRDLCASWGLRLREPIGMPVLGVGGRRSPLFLLPRPSTLEFQGFSCGPFLLGAADLRPWRRAPGAEGFWMEFDALLGADRLGLGGALIDSTSRRLYWFGVKNQAGPPGRQPDSPAASAARKR